MNQNIDNKLDEGIFGALLFKNSLAQDMYKDYYVELSDAIKAKDKAKATKLYDEFLQDLEDLKSENKKWHAEFIDAHEKLLSQYKSAIDELADVTEVDEKNVEAAVHESWDEYDDDYYDLDDVEQDRVHAALYGGDRTYCSCGQRLVPDEDGYFYCPVCD